jgi:aspartate/methionine/tyrosine aminotransferase
MAGFFNDWFSPAVPIEPAEIMAGNGVSGLLNTLAFNICDAGEGIIVPVPNYAMLELDFCAFTGVEFITLDTSDLEDCFSASNSQVVIAAFDKTLADAQQRGVTVRAVLLTNPSNPLGRYYSRTTLIEIAAFCGRNNLHLVCDEIYALSGFESPEDEKLPRFTSVLSIEADVKNYILPENIHCLYGASKDWSMGGIRLGFLVTRNQKVFQACRKVA